MDTLLTETMNATLRTKSFLQRRIGKVSVDVHVNELDRLAEQWKIHTRASNCSLICFAKVI
jgi:hypothetical protein